MYFNPIVVVLFLSNIQLEHVFYIDSNLLDIHESHSVGGGGYSLRRC